MIRNLYTRLVLILIVAALAIWVDVSDEIQIYNPFNNSVLVNRNIAPELGLDLQVETIPDPNAISTLTGTNQLDVGGFGVNINPFQAAARGIGMKMVADKGSLRPGFGYAALLGRQDLMDSGQLRSPADIRGRTITKLAPCDSSDPWFERLFQRGGFSRDDIGFLTFSSLLTLVFAR